MKGQVQLESKTALFAVSYCDDNSPITPTRPDSVGARFGARSQTKRNS